MRRCLCLHGWRIRSLTDFLQVRCRKKDSRCISGNNHEPREQAPTEKIEGKNNSLVSVPATHATRTIDPPPVLQLLIDDFDAANDVPFLKAHDWVVHTKLIYAEQPQEDVNSIRPQSEGQSQDKITRLLLGTTVSSPFFCADDPDPDYAPKHPSTKPTPPPSPTMRIIKVSRDAASARKEAEAHKKFPGAYFIFADLSVRKAGQYRLEFRLMKMEPSALVTNSFVPTISVAVSDIFNVVNAKDFDQVQPSTNLVKGLIDRGAGFPLKLKKGLREGQRRKNRPDVDDDGDDDDPDDHENRDDAGDEDIEEEDE